MKISLFTILCLVATSSISFGQSRVTCSDDTLLYTREKASGNDTVIIDPIFTQRVYQYFEGPQDISVKGVKFYAFNPYDTGASNVSVTVELHSATSDSLPASAVLASGTVNISYPDSFDGPLNSYAHVVTWATPVTVSSDYVIVIKNNSVTQPLALFRNMQGDGLDEWLNGAYQLTGWIRSYFFQVEGVPFNSDFYIEPIVSYEVNAGFTNDPECLFDELGEEVTFLNTGAPIVDSRMYNRFAYYGSNLRQQWTFGDGSGQFNVIDPVHNYPSNGPYGVNFKVQLLSWYNNICESSVNQQLKQKPLQDFNYQTYNLAVDFTNNTPGLFTDVSYDFGDGNFSLDESPYHKFAAPGTYWVCQSMLTSCGYVSHCENVAVATNTALNCGKDSVRYTTARGTDTRMVQFKPNNPGRLIGFGQIFPAPQEMVVHGFTFYATHDGLYRDNYEVICKIYDEVGGEPDTVALATSSVRIKRVDVDTFYNDSIKYTAIFDQPVNITEDYILTIEYEENNHVSIASTDYVEGDGLSDYKALAKKNDTLWVSAASSALFNVNGVAFNADFLFEPLVEYNFDANFITDVEFECLKGEPVPFTNISSPIASSPVYNQLVYYGSSASAYLWDFGDGTPDENAINPTHSFVGKGPFDVSMQILMEGWTNVCLNTQEKNMPVRPTGGFTYVKTLSQVDFTDTSFNAEDHWWTFSDNSFSSLASPTHYFTDTGSFEVCQYVSNECGSDTNCVVIDVSVLGMDEFGVHQLIIYPNPATDQLLVQGELINGKGYLLMYDLAGRPVYQTHLFGSSFKKAIDVTDFARGTYLLRIETNEGYIHKKVVLH